MHHPIGAFLGPYYRIGGQKMAQPLFTTYVQTHGSFSRMGPRVSAIILVESPIVEHLDKFEAKSSTEAEWASVLFGLCLALNKNQTSIRLGNNNLSVIHGLTFIHYPLKQDYANYYRDQIIKVAAESNWTGVRWIPRENNEANKLL